MAADKEICKICDSDKEVLDGVCVSCEDAWYDEIKQICTVSPDDQTIEDMLERAAENVRKIKLSS